MLSSRYIFVRAGFKTLRNHGMKKTCSQTEQTAVAALHHKTSLIITATVSDHLCHPLQLHPLIGLHKYLLQLVASITMTRQVRQKKDFPREQRDKGIMKKKGVDKVKNLSQVVTRTQKVSPKKYSSREHREGKQKTKIRDKGKIKKEEAKKRADQGKAEPEADKQEPKQQEEVNKKALKRRAEAEKDLKTSKPEKLNKKTVKRSAEPESKISVKRFKLETSGDESGRTHDVLEGGVRDEESGKTHDVLDEGGDFLHKIVKQREAICENVAHFRYNKKRVRILTDAEEFSKNSNGILYWMSRDQRVQDNWAFLYAQRLALKLKAPLYICFCLVPKFLDATIRQFGFMMKGLAKVEQECRDLKIPFYLLIGEGSKVIPGFLKKHNIGGVVTDFSPLRTPTKWVNDLKSALPDNIPLCQVDAHNLVPCWEASPKLEYAARTIRNKIHKQLGYYLTEFPPLVEHPHPACTMPPVTDWKKADSSLEVDRTVQEVAWAKPGTEAGLRMLESFIEKRLKSFATCRNDPNKDSLSNLSPWIHFGQISAQRCILMVKVCRNKAPDSVDTFIEEAVIRRELADNFCFYNENYDSIKGAYDWAQKTLETHRNDKRPSLYTREQLELGKTQDNLWNAAQTQLVLEGKMHGFLRMYWAKKILEWTESPERALADSIYLNDRYNLDGRDPNGYVGCMWSICGTHDQGWCERPVFGKIRYMNYQGCKRKFDVDNIILTYKKKKEYGVAA